MTQRVDDLNKLQNRNSFCSPFEMSVGMNSLTVKKDAKMENSKRTRIGCTTMPHATYVYQWVDEHWMPAAYDVARHAHYLGPGYYFVDGRYLTLTYDQEAQMIKYHWRELPPRPEDPDAAHRWLRPGGRLAWEWPTDGLRLPSTPTSRSKTGTNNPLIPPYR